jgi:NDP-sugar pyrophosphorylase family protein
MRVGHWVARKERNLSIKYHTFFLKVVSKVLFGEIVFFGRNNIFSSGSKIIFASDSTINSCLKFGDDFTARKNVLFKVGKKGKIIVGNNVFVNDSCSFYCQHKISIGDDCMFGSDVNVFDQNHRFNLKDVAVSKQGYTVSEVIIGKKCWIGRGVTILKGVTIGDNCVIGAHCLISSDVPSETVVRLSATNLDFSKINYK